MSELKGDRFVANLAQQEKNSLATFKGWLGKHPEVVDCEANLKAFREYADFTDGLTEDDFTFTLSNIRDRLALQRIPTPQEIVNAENKHRKKLSLPELHELAREENPAPTRDPLPAVWFGADISTAQGLKQLARKNITSFKHLVNRYGADAVNIRMGVTPSKPVGRSISLSI
jgi:hypothetical protein